jgi:hypothetical protein
LGCTVQRQRLQTSSQHAGIKQSAKDAYGLEALRAPTLPLYDDDFIFPTEVCIRIARTKEQSKRRVCNLIPIMVFNDRPTCKDRHAAELILARSTRLHQKAEYIAADLSSRPNFSLQSRGRPYIIGNNICTKVN